MPTLLLLHGFPLIVPHGRAAAGTLVGPFYDYRFDDKHYSARRAWLRRNRPPLLVRWGRYDPSFRADEAEAYRREVTDAIVHRLDARHFELDEKPDVVAEHVRRAMLSRRELKMGTVSSAR